MWSEILSILSVVITGSGAGWFYIKDKRKQEREKTKQEQIKSNNDEYQHILNRLDESEQHTSQAMAAVKEFRDIVIKQDKRIVVLEQRSTYAESNICLLTTCRRRQPALGTYKSERV
jgi:hypothetical protein